MSQSPLLEDRLILTENGFPALVEMADVPDAGSSRVDPNAKSGNPRHDVRSGKFGSGKKRKPTGPPKPDNVDPLEFKRFVDAVREAARLFDTPDVAQIQEWLKGRAKNPGQVDAEGFLRSVIAQQLTDMVDVLNAQLGGRSAKRVQVKSPRTFVNRALQNMDGPSVAEITHRLIALGHSEEKVKKLLKRRLPEARQADIDGATLP